MLGPRRAACLGTNLIRNPASNGITLHPAPRLRRTGADDSPKPSCNMLGLLEGGGVPTVEQLLEEDNEEEQGEQPRTAGEVGPLQAPEPVEVGPMGPMMLPG